jgi:hypothetical protein
MAEGQREHARSNRLLGALEASSRKRIDTHLEPIKLELGAIVCDAGGLLKHAYFPEGAVLSLLTVLENGSAIETANIGREGAFGLFAAMYSRVSFNRCLVQLEGSIVRCPIEVLQSDSNAANTCAISSSAIRRRFCHRFNRPSHAMLCIQRKREYADGCS